MTLPDLPPGTLLLVGALAVPLLPARWRSAWLLLLPILSGSHLLWFLPDGTEVPLEFFSYPLLPIRVDKLSLVWGCIFHVAALLNVIYSLHVKDTVQHISALWYAGAAIGAVFAGDLITLFIYWELTAVTSVFLIWAGRGERSYAAGMRYLIVQVSSGLLLLSGIVFHYRDTGSLAFVDALAHTAGVPDAADGWRGLNTIGTTLIFIALGIKAAFPLLHNWLQDAYPEATPTGTVWLSAFTTKLAIYALARGFPGTELLIWIGAIMAVFPLFYAAVENDLRRALAYGLNNQLGFMVVGVGIGTPLSLTGAATHAVAHIVYEGLLFMTLGAVLLRTGTTKVTDLGGLYRSMPWTAAFCIVGAASISAVPLLSGFVTKSLVVSAAAKEHHTAAWLMLLFASAGVAYNFGARLPFCAFFGRDSGKRVAEAPANMLIAMGLAAMMSLGIGVLPSTLYRLTPFEVDYAPYTATHIVTQLQLLLWAALAFVVVKRTGLYPAETRAINLDTDWLYRWAAPRLVRHAWAGGDRLRGWCAARCLQGLHKLVDLVGAPHQPGGLFDRTRSTGVMVIWVAILLLAYLLLSYRDV